MLQRRKICCPLVAFAASLIRDLRIEREAIDLARSLASIFRYLGLGIRTNARMLLSARHKAFCRPWVAYLTHAVTHVKLWSICNNELFRGRFRNFADYLLRSESGSGERPYKSQRQISTFFAASPPIVEFALLPRRGRDGGSQKYPEISIKTRWFTVTYFKCQTRQTHI